MCSSLFFCIPSAIAEASFVTYKRTSNRGNSQKFFNYLENLKPSPEVLQLFEVVMTDYAQSRNRELTSERQRIANEIHALRNQKKRLDDLIIAAPSFAGDFFHERTVDATADTINPGFLISKLTVSNTDTSHNAYMQFDGQTATQNTADPTTDSKSIMVPKSDCIEKEFRTSERPDSISVICGAPSCAKIRVWAED